MTDWTPHTAQAKQWFEALRDAICAEFEAIEREAGSDASFGYTPWQRDAVAGEADTGGGVQGLMKGKVFEKVGVNVSTVHGAFSPQFAGTINGASADAPQFTATGISLVAHMANPHVPAVHMNTRFLTTTKAWFGGGADLNPPLPYDEDTADFHAAFKAAAEHKGQPTVILAHTIKGYGLGKHFEGRNATHQMKKMTLDDLKLMRDFLKIPITDAQLEENPYLPPYYKPDANDPAMQYLQERRRALGGYVPERRSSHVPVTLPDAKTYEIAAKGSGTQTVATTMGFVRLLKDLIRDKEFGPRIVPIIPDEARTFGMDAFFPNAKIYNPNGQHYISVDRDLLLAYKEDPTGTIIHVGINEAGALAAFTAVGTSYSTQGQPLIPVYVFYSMFGFQRTGDAFWLAGDQMTRGFIIGATAGRTTLTGEGLQHADGHSHIIAQTNPAVVAYDPAYTYEIGHIMRDGLQRMYGGTHPDPNVMYYITVYNEPLVQPAEPENLDVEGVLRGIYKLAEAPIHGTKAQILASGVGVPWALEAQQLLANDWGISADVWSVTSWTELRRDGVAADQFNMLNPEAPAQVPYVTSKLQGSEGPFVAVSDFNHLVPDMIRPWVPGTYATLGADNFGFSDTRAAARRFFLIDGPSVVVQTLSQLAAEGKVDRSLVRQAIDKYRLLDVNAGTSGSTGGDA